MYTKEDVALMERNHTGPPCSVGHPTAHAASPPTRRQRYIRRQTTDASQQNNAGLLGGPVITDGYDTVVNRDSIREHR